MTWCLIAVSGRMNLVNNAVKPLICQFHHWRNVPPVSSAGESVQGLLEGPEDFQGKSDVARRSISNMLLFRRGNDWLGGESNVD